MQQALSLSIDGVVGRDTRAALLRRVRSHPRSCSGNIVEIDLRRQLGMIVRAGKLSVTLNTSTGGGYLDTGEGLTARATTPRGVFTVFRQVDRIDVSPLGELWRPKYFSGGDAIH